MKRRTFLHTAAMTAASLSANKVFAGLRKGAFEKDNAEPAKGKTLRLKGDYYQHHPVDFSRGRLGALGFEGWGNSVDVNVAADQTALIPMHIWNIGFSPQLSFKPEGPAAPIMKMLEWASRSGPITRSQIPPVLQAARDGGIRVIHVASDEHYALKYPGYEMSKQVAGPEPEGLPSAPMHDYVKTLNEERADLVFGPGRKEARPHYLKHLDFPPQARPLDDEYVTFTTHQLNGVLRKHGIWNLIYIGFAINWCLWFSPGGMVDMSRLGYRCNCIEEATTAVENKESVENEFNKKQSMWRTSLMFGYIHHADDFIQACYRMNS
ncbi:isochorismatase family protein [candidate division KSB1 bacterium]|nr:isochorismatase family protein [candidate division KSB1 bacterium]